MVPFPAQGETFRAPTIYGVGGKTQKKNPKNPQQTQMSSALTNEQAIRSNRVEEVWP